MTSRERVNAALAHKKPDKLPVDFLATTEIWDKLRKLYDLQIQALPQDSYFDPVWEEILRKLEVDCRVVSYDQFCAPPADAFEMNGHVECWKVLSRSTPARMWRFIAEDGFAYDVFGRRFKVQKNDKGSYEENIPVLSQAESLADVRKHRWPDPSWWDFSALPSVVRQMNLGEERHIRYRMGSIFEIAWQLRGMDTFFMDLALQPEIPKYLMERITDICVENAERALKTAGDTIDMVYFYDDIASNSGLMISETMWEEFIQPNHQRLIDTAKKYGKQVMYHSDGSLASVLDRIIDMGVDVLNPIQPNTRDMEPEKLKNRFGDRLAFHGGIDIVELLPHGSPEQVQKEATRIASVLGSDGGFVMASSHHIQPDTPIENVTALYDLRIR